MFKKNKEETIDWCPSHSGESVAYKPEYFDGVDGWKEIQLTKAENQIGIPAPKHLGELYSFIGLHGYEQAMALAWWYAANHRATGYSSIKVRVQAYKFMYSLKAHKIDLNRDENDD